MEEDIRFLEKMIKEYRTFGDLYNEEFEDTEKIYTAIENLIKAYKELEEENKSYKKGIARYKKKCSRMEETYIDESVKRISERFKINYIPKSVIREKIEELKECIEEAEKNIKNTTDEEKEYWKKQKHDLVMQRNILQEILEG